MSNLNSLDDVMDRLAQLCWLLGQMNKEYGHTFISVMPDYENGSYSYTVHLSAKMALAWRPAKEWVIVPMGLADYPWTGVFHDEKYHIEFHCLLKTKDQLNEMERAGEEVKEA